MQRELSTPIRLSRAQVREVDRLAIEAFHIPGIVLMENAARSVVDVALQMAPANGTVVIVCGGGNNGGDGFAVGRHLHNRGLGVRIVNTASDLKGDALINFRIAEAMGIPIGRSWRDGELIIDALFGTGLSRPPYEDAAALIGQMNQAGVPILAVDLPSGLDCDTGEPLGACVRATRTVTFVAEKTGFANPASRVYTGEVIVGDIGCPRELIERVRRA
jgi:NAD(P)H-hydrate epimerase